MKEEIYLMEVTIIQAKFCPGSFCFFQIHSLLGINAVLPSVLILNPLKPRENLWFSGVFKGYKIETLNRNKLR